MRNILILTYEIPNNRFAGSMQLLRVFQNYPADKLYVIGPAIPVRAKSLDCPYKLLHFPIQRWRNTRFHRWAMSAALCLRFLRPGCRSIRRELGNFKPDVVFTVMDNVSYFLTAYEFAKASGLSLITMTMDEPDSFEKIFPLFTSLQQRKIGNVYQYAEKNLCVSRQMTAHIASKFKCNTQAFYFGPPDGMTPRPAEMSGEDRVPGVFTLGYAGGLAYGYREAIQRISRALIGVPVKIRIYSRDKPDFDLNGNIQYAGCFPHEELWGKFQIECDASLLIYDFFHPESRLYRTHFPTKLSEYTWLGMPMVMVGPDFATGIIWGLEHPQAALVETEASLKTFAAKVKGLAANSERRMAMATAAQTAGAVEFNPARIRNCFEQLLAISKAEVQI